MDPGPLKFDNILREAEHITAVDRTRFYGHPRANHANTAAMWTAYLERKFGFTGTLIARDVCAMMILLKISRDANKPNRDNLVDIAGYARNAEQVEEAEAMTQEVREGVSRPLDEWTEGIH
jgi:hypothetical protein